MSSSPPGTRMPRARSIPLCLVSLVLIFSVPARAASEPPWLQITSAHFTVITDAGDKRGREVALRFEQMRAAFGSLLGKEHLHQSVPLTILALQNDKSYYQSAPLRQGQPIDLPGFFIASSDQDFAVLNLSEEEPWRAVAHDFAFMLLSYNYPPAQAWFDDGLCEYFSTVRVDNKQVEMGSDPGFQQLATSLPANPQPPLPRTLTELLNTQEWLPIPQLFAIKPVSAATRAGDEGPHPLYYAESWAVMHYLVHEKKMPETGAYLGLVLAQHVPIEDAIKQAYGVTSAQFEQAVKDYFHAQLAGAAPDSAPKAASTAAAAGPIERSPAIVGPDDSSLVVRPMPESDAQAMYAGIQVRVPERREAALKTLQQLATTPTAADKKAELKATKKTGEDEQQLPSDAEGDPIAHRMLAWDHIEHGEFQEAFTEIGDTAALNPRDMWVHYYLSLAKYRMALAKHGEIPGIANMMLDLKAFLEWDPDMADAYDLLALARNGGGSPTAAMQSERAAMTLSPREEIYPLHLAQIYITSKRWEAAEALLERLKAGGNPQIAAQAGELLAQAGTQRKYGLAASGTTTAQQPKYEAQKTPFDALDEEAAKRVSAENTDAGSAVPQPHSMKFVSGRLVNVDCSNPPAAILTISSGSATLKLRAPDYKSVLLIGTDAFSCDWRDRKVTANYKPRGSEGDLVSLEMH